MPKTELPSFFLAVDGASESEVVGKLLKISHVEGEYGIKLNLDLVAGYLKDFSVVERIKRCLSVKFS